MKSLFTTLLTLCLFLSPISSQAYPWKQTQVSATDGTKITLNFTVLEYSYYGNPIASTQDFWIHINRSGLKSTDQVRVVFISYPYWAPYPGFYEISEIDLEFVGNEEFRIDASKTLGYKNIFNGHQELAVVINGQWLKDSWNPESSNFQLRLLPFRERN